MSVVKLTDLLTVLALICLTAVVVWDTAKLPPEPQGVARKAGW